MATTGIDEDYLQCSYENWSSEFQEFVHKSVIIPLPQNVLLYLMSDLMVLPKNAKDSSGSTRESNSMWHGTEEELEEPDFKEFDEKLKNSIEDLGGKVFIKLNWSAPKDASWITSTRSLCCSDPGDIYLLLKSSSCICNDLSVLSGDAETSCGIPCFLILKKWEEIHPGTEYRCFIMDNNLLGICQRDTTSYFKYIGDNKDSIVELITSFFRKNVQSKFSLQSYVFDIVVAAGNKIIIIDFGVLNKDTDCLMFTLEELNSLKKILDSEEVLKSLKSNDENPSCDDQESGIKESACKNPEFRFIDEFTDVAPNQCRHYGIPVDVMHFCTGEKNVADYIQEEIINNSL